MLVCDATRSCHETSSKPDEVSAALLFCAKTSLRSGSRALSNSIIANSTGVLAEGRRKRPQRRAGVEMKVAKRIPKIILSSRADVQNILRRNEVPIMCLNDFSRIRRRAKSGENPRKQASALSAHENFAEPSIGGRASVKTDDSFTTQALCQLSHISQELQPTIMD